jgi:hypothetical protein
MLPTKAEKYKLPVSSKDIPLNLYQVHSSYNPLALKQAEIHLKTKIISKKVYPPQSYSQSKA